MDVKDEDKSEESKQNHIIYYKSLTKIIKNMENEIIFENVKYLINENLVRGGIDEEQNQSFPWISRLTETGIKLIEDAKK